MKKESNLFLTIILIFGSFFTTSNVIAQNFLGDHGDSIPEQAITNFVSHLVVNRDNSVDVTEEITYNTGDTAHHGIFRDIDPYSSQKRKMGITVKSVLDEKGDPYQYQVMSQGKYLRIKIGDPNVTFQGEKIYIIKYHATDAVAQYKDLDEIYWNITGNDWLIPIYKAEAFFTLPEDVKVIQSSCYYGSRGSSYKCKAESDSSFSSPLVLNPGDGLTAAVGFPKGLVVPYSSSDNLSNFFQKYLNWFLAAILPLLTLIIMMVYWYKYGRDPKGTGVIVPQYDIPDNLTPLEVGALIYEKLVNKNLSAEIIYLASKGYITIREVEKKTLGLFTSKDYELTSIKSGEDLQNDFDQRLIRYLFFKPYLKSFENPNEDDRKKVKISEIKKIRNVNFPAILKLVPVALLEKGYYKNLGRLKKAMNPVSSLILFFAYMAIHLVSSLAAVLSLALSILIYVVVYHFSPVKTEKGVATKEYIQGLKMYLQIAEKDRLEFHNAPEKKPEIFEKLLPYAMVLGVADIWAKEFEGVYTTPPTWYYGTPGSNFNTVTFNHSISSFAVFSSSFGSSGGGGMGSGGGGFSGGGGGGGGGGGW